MGKSILFISTMYPNPLRPGTKVCHYFTKHWVDMGNDVIVIHYRSMFPQVLYLIARLFPKLRKKYVGSNVKLDNNRNIVVFEEDKIPVYSIPIFKYLPHGKYSKKTIENKVSEIVSILEKKDFTPDLIIGHFYNPQLEIVSRLKDIYTKAKTCVTLHENSEVICDVYGNKAKEIVNSIDTIGCRSYPIMKSFEKCFGVDHKRFLCWSGTPEFFLSQPLSEERHFSDGPMKNYIYVGDLIERKFPKQTIEGVHKAMGDLVFSFVYVGAKDVAFNETAEYVKSNRLENQVSFTGKIPRTEIVNYYDKSDCFILISKSEVFGLVYLEAMARGCITIASRNEGMEGIIENGVNGFLCEAGNSEELASIIKSINNLSSKEKQLISTKAKEKAFELSDYNVAKRYLDNVI